MITWDSWKLKCLFCTELFRLVICLPWYCWWVAQVCLLWRRKTKALSNVWFLWADVGTGYMCCGGSHQAGPVTLRVLCPSPPTSVSTARPGSTWYGECCYAVCVFAWGVGKGRRWTAFFLSSHQWCYSFPLGKCWRLTRQNPYRGSVGLCCGLINLHPISMDWWGTGSLVTWYL